MNTSHLIEFDGPIDRYGLHQRPLGDMQYFSEQLETRYSIETFFDISGPDHRRLDDPECGFLHDRSASSMTDLMKLSWRYESGMKLQYLLRGSGDVIASIADAVRVALEEMVSDWQQGNFLYIYEEKQVP